VISVATKTEDFVTGPLLTAVLEAQDATQALIGGAGLFTAAERLVDYAVGRGCDRLVAASPAAERLVGAALMRGQGVVRALGAGEEPDGVKAVVVDLVVAGAVSVETMRDLLLARGAAHVEAVVCGTRGDQVKEVVAVLV